MSSRLNEEFVRSKNVRMAVWSLLIAYVAIYIYAERTGSIGADALRNVMFGVLIGGFGVYLAAQYDSDDTVMTLAAALFILGGLANVIVAVLVPLGMVAPGMINLVALPVFFGLGLWLFHWVQSSLR